MDTQSTREVGRSGHKRQAFTRELNDRLRRLAQQESENGSVRLLCECGRCRETIEVAVDLYAQARRTPDVLLVKRGHQPETPARSQGDDVLVVDGAAAA